MERWKEGKKERRKEAGKLERKKDKKMTERMKEKREEGKKKSKWRKNKVIRPKSRALAFHKNLGRRTDWSSQNDPQISILYLPVRVEIRFDYQSPVILCRNKWHAKK